MKIGIAILNWNGLNLLKSHLKKVVSKSNNSCVYIIDNNSSDGSVKFVRENFPEVNIISLDKNYVELNDKKFPLLLGMDTSILIKLRQKPLIEYFTNAFKLFYDPMKNVKTN